MKILESKNYDIEALRAYAILITIVAHFVELIPEWASWISFFWLGGGVDLFFAISGFLIAKSLLELADRQQKFWRFAAIFWVKRIFRLWPAALFWSTITLIIYAMINPENLRASHDMVWQSWIFAALNVENIYIYFCIQETGCKQTPIWHYWSLSNEEQFYVLLTFMLFFSPASLRRWLIIPCFLAAMAQVLTVRPWGTLLWFIRSDAMFFGTIIALSWHYYGAYMHKLQSKIPRGALQALVLVAMALVILVARDEVSIRYHGLVAIFSGLTVMAVSSNRNLLTHQKPTRTFLSFIGSRSYSIYLVHFPVFVLMRDVIISTNWLDLTVQLDRIAMTFIAIMITLILSDFSYRYVENPLRKWGREKSTKIQSSPELQPS